MQTNVEPRMIAQTRVNLWSILLLIALSVYCVPVSAQEIGIEYGGTHAGYGDALERPTGLSGYLDLPLSERIAIRLSGAHYTEKRTITRSPCTGLVRPGRDCTSEPFDGDGSLTTYGVGVAIGLHASGATLQPELYALVTGSSVDVNFTAQTGDEQIQPITPDGLSPGVALGGSISYEITSFFALSSRFGVQVPRFGACGSDAWFPFCERRVLPHLALGVRFGLSGFYP
jgi:hypothetical protein